MTKFQCATSTGLDVCSTPGDGIQECALKLKDGFFTSLDETELTPSKLWETMVKCMFVILLASILIFLMFQLIKRFLHESLPPTPEVPLTPALTTIAVSYTHLRAHET